jgi:hypothetical protein
LGEGYQLAIKNVDVDGNKAYVELSKNGNVVDSEVIQPSAPNAGMAEKTYYYKVDLGDTKEIILAAIHFKNAFKGADTNIATVDGEFQISDILTSLKSDQQYDKMSIRNVNPTDYTITMDNKDNQITLSKNKDVVLMQNIHIKTADQDTITADQPLRYYIYKAATIPVASADVPASAAGVQNVTDVAANVTKEAAQAKEKAADVAGAVTITKGNVTAAAKNATAEAQKKQPGFEGIFAINGLMIVAYLLGRK